jgi:hypothetical protein
MLLMKFEPIFSAGERPQTYALDRTTTGIGHGFYDLNKFFCLLGMYVRNHFRPFLVTRIRSCSLLLPTVKSAF